MDLFTSLSIVSEMLDVAVDVVTGISTLIVTAISGVVSVFWDSATSTLTVPGVLGVFALGTSFAMLGFGFVKGLIRK